MKAQDLASLFFSRIGDWGLEWEVLWVTFQTLIDNTPITEEDIERALAEGFSEWDV